MMGIPTSDSEKSNNISCSVVPKVRDFPFLFYRIVVDGRSSYLQLFARGFSSESDEFLKCLHLPPVIQ
jgi:hypothetical protein